MLVVLLYAQITMYKSAYHFNFTRFTVSIVFHPYV